MKNLVLILLLFITINSYSQTEYKLKCDNKTTIRVLEVENSNVTDSISVYPRSINKQHSYVKVFDRSIMRSHLVIPGVASFKNTYISIEKWDLKNGTLKLSNKVKIKPKECNLKKLSFKLVENGIEWKIKKGLFRKSLTGFISFDDYSDKEYVINCSGSVPKWSFYENGENKN